MLQRDGLFRRREEGLPRSTPSSTIAQPAPAAGSTAAVSATSSAAPAEAAKAQIEKSPTEKAQAEKPVIEVHISNIFRREAFRHHSWVSSAAKGVICGLGIKGYALALEAMADLVKA